MLCRKCHWLMVTPSVVPTMLIIAFVTQPRIRQFISTPR